MAPKRRLKIKGLDKRANNFFKNAVDWTQEANWKEAQEAVTNKVNQGIEIGNKLINNGNYSLKEQVEEFIDSLQDSQNIVLTKTFESYATKAFEEVDIDGNKSVDKAEFYAGIMVLYHQINMIPWGGRKPPPKRKYVMKMYDRWMKIQTEEGREDDGLVLNTWIRLCQEHFAQIVGGVLSRIILVAVVFPIIALYLKQFLMVIPGIKNALSPFEALVPSLLVSLFVTLLPYAEAMVVKKVYVDKEGFALLTV